MVENDGMATQAEILSFQEKIGSLIWLVVSTRPDIAWVTAKLARFARNPSKAHFTALQRVFRYLAGTIDLSIVYTGSGSTEDASLRDYCDSDWAGPHSDKKLSTSGYLFTLAGGPVSWQSKKQRSVALSSTEAEYVSQALQ